jgi:ABC-type nitrate/sulfonate/bicarbonate transport system ATPase subunit
VTSSHRKVVASGVGRSFAGRHGDLAALGPLDLEIAEGEFVALVGPSGCGKTTFLRIVGGLLNPTEGPAGWREAARSFGAGRRQQPCEAPGPLRRRAAT